ncbi:MAG: delta-60 repeat domain-containing protein [Spirochaetes bacterium]|nr:delta-60 repeat domain-containing protein [Spirochaetota bacterium]HOD15751.1 delta-60 repeat domain-containing protein [Spirochaetota bacterium]
MKRFVQLLFACALAVSLLACSNDLYWGHWGADGTVYTTRVHDGRLYLGGTFNNVMAYTGGGAMVDRVKGMLVAKKKVPYINGSVMAVASDGRGGWFIGGDFSKINGETRNKIARINANGSLNAWNPGADGTVYSLVVSDGVLYVGGDFSTIAGQTRNNVSRFNAKGVIESWDPDADNRVNCIVVSGATVYVGGAFTTIGGAARNYIAALDRTSGSATAWNPGADLDVFCLALSGTTLYAGGIFTAIGGAVRTELAALDTTLNTNNATSWAPVPNSYIYSIVVSGSTVYVCGGFSSIAGQPRGGIAALDAAGNGTTVPYALGWNPNSSGNVYSIAVTEDTVYAGGNYTTIGGASRSRIAALDRTTGLATAWDPDADSHVWSIALSKDAVYFGGTFIRCCKRSRNNIASIDLTTGLLSDWNPNAGTMVRAIAGSGNVIYVGGDFSGASSIGGQDRNYIAALDVETGLATDWNPDSDAPVYAITISSGTVYAGGEFVNIGGQNRNYIAALDADTGLATDWDPDSDTWVYTLVVSKGTVYAGGEFNSIGGQVRRRIAALDAETGLATDWDPNANGRVRSMALSGGTLYAGGNFNGADSIGGQARNRLAALDTETGLATDWDPSATAEIYAVAVSKDAVYAGGSFVGAASIGGADRDYLAAIDPVTGLATSWNPAVDNIVWSLSLSGDNVIASGSFTTLAGGDYNSVYLCGIDAETGLLRGW